MRVLLKEKNRRDKVGKMAGEGCVASDIEIFYDDHWGKRQNMSSQESYITWISFVEQMWQDLESGSGKLQ